MSGIIDPALPPARGLFDPALGHDACGVGFIAHVKNRKSHEIVQQGLQAGDKVVVDGVQKLVPGRPVVAAAAKPAEPAAAKPEQGR